METIWLRENNPKLTSYKRGMVVGENTPKPVEKDKFVPHFCEKDTYCHCGLSKMNVEPLCEISSSNLFTLVKSSCQKREIDSKIKSG